MEVFSVFIAFAFSSVLQRRISFAKLPPFNRYCQSVPPPFFRHGEALPVQIRRARLRLRRQVYLPSILIIRLLYSLSRRFSLVAGPEFSVVTSLEPQSGFHWRCNFYRVKPVAAKGLLPPYRGELYPEKKGIEGKNLRQYNREIKNRPHHKARPVWRSGWDSNPRNLAVQLISSQPRYDHFDTAPRWQRQVRKENYTAWRGKLQMLAEAIPGAA